MHARLALLTIALVACSKSKGETGAAPRLFTEDEIARYQGALQARLAENAKRSCPRPVVREPGVDGPAGPDLIALVEPTGELATCLTTAAKLATSSSTKVGELIEARDPKLVELDGTCGDLLEQAVLAAAAHRDACSPYQIGVRKDPDTWMNAMYGAHLLGLHARLSAERGTPAFALTMLVEGVAAYRDLGRGRAGLIASMIAVAASNILLDQARAIVTTAKLSRADLDGIVASVDVLLRSEPPFADTLGGERDFFELYYGMPPLQGATWSPPGGWPTGTGPAAAGSDEGPYGTKSMTKSPRDDGAVMFAAAERMANDRAKACPQTASLKSCHDGLVALGEAASKLDGKEVGAKLWQDLAAAAGSADVEAVRLKIRGAIVDILANVAHVAFSKYAVKRANGYAEIAAFRIHLEILRAGHCPTEAELVGPPYPALRAPDALGDSLAIATLPGGDLEVSPPAWTESKKPAWRISCKPR